MEISTTAIPGVLILTPRIFSDHRGYFMESFNEKDFKALTKLEVNFVQDNQSFSKKDTLRGLHYQTKEFQQAKLVRAIQGEILDVIVDLRPDSPTYGQHVKIVIDDQKHQQVFVPRGCAHGFLVLSETAIFGYKCDNYYNKDFESGIIFNDKDLNIDWGVDLQKVVLSPKDLELDTFKNHLSIC